MLLEQKVSYAVIPLFHIPGFTVSLDIWLATFDSLLIIISILHVRATSVMSHYVVLWSDIVHAAIKNLSSL